MNYNGDYRYATCPDALVEILVVVGRSVNIAAFQPGVDIGGKVTWLRRGPNCYDFEERACRNPSGRPVFVQSHAINLSVLLVGS